MAGTERLSSEELEAILAAGTGNEPAPGGSSQEQSDELHSGSSEGPPGAELLGARILGFLHRNRALVSLSLTVVLVGIIIAGWYVLNRIPPIDPVIHARIRYVSTYREQILFNPAGAAISVALRTTLRITSDDPQSQLQVTGIAVVGAGLPPIQMAQDGASIILTTEFTCPTTVPATVALRLRVGRVDQWGRTLVGELPILPGVGGDLLSGHAVALSPPTDSGINPVIDIINQYCPETDVLPFSSTLTITPPAIP